VVFESPFNAITQFEKDFKIPKHFINRVIAKTGDNGSFAKLEKGDISLDQFYPEFEKECELYGQKVPAYELMQYIKKL